MATGKNALLQWCKNCTEGYPNVNITNFHMSWANGLAFCALIHAHRPNLIPYDTLKPENKVQNMELAFSTATKLGIPALLDVEDMFICAKPEQFSIMTYLSQFYHFFKTGNAKASGLGTIKIEPTVTTQKRPAASALAPPRKEPELSSPPPKRPKVEESRPSCVKCNKPLSGNTVEAPGGMYHENCFGCYKCGKKLQRCLNVDNKPYCDTCGRDALRASKRVSIQNSKNSSSNAANISAAASIVGAAANKSRWQKEREEKEKREKEQQERFLREKREKEQQAKESREKQERERKEKQEREKREREERERKTKLDREKREREQREREEKQRKEKEERDRKLKADKDKRDREQRERDEKQRKEREQREREERQRKEREERDRKAKADKDKREREQREREEKQRKEREDKDKRSKEERERKEKQEREKREREEREQRDRKVKEDQIKREKEQREREEKQRKEREEREKKAKELVNKTSQSEIERKRIEQEKKREEERLEAQKIEEARLAKKTSIKPTAPNDSGEVKNEWMQKVNQLNKKREEKRKNFNDKPKTEIKKEEKEEIIIKSEPKPSKLEKTQSFIEDNAEKPLPSNEIEEITDDMVEPTEEELNKVSEDVVIFNFEEKVSNLEGYLHQKVKRKKWIKRWFSVQDGRITSYSSNPNTTKSGSRLEFSRSLSQDVVIIPLDSIDVIIPNIENCEFSIKTTNKSVGTIHLRCSTEEEVAIWMSGIYHCVNTELRDPLKKEASETRQSPSIKEGFLQKRKKANSWKKYWFCLRNGFLVCYLPRHRKNMSKRPLFKLALFDCKIDEHEPEKYECAAFQITTQTDEKIVLLADNAENMLFWINAILKEKFLIEETINSISFTE